MTKHKDGTVSLVIERRFDRSAQGPLHRQLYQLLRQMVVEGDVAGGTKLPSSRTLAEELGLSRHTVATAIDQLLGEGYLVGRVGSGTYVSSHFAPHPRDLAASVEPRGASSFSRRGTQMVSAPRSPFSLEMATSGAPRAFRVGLPAIDLFPGTLWSRALTAAWKDISPGRLGYQGALGHPPLREAVASYLRASRGLACRAEQVIIVAGSQSALDLCLRVLIDPGDVVALEDPGYLGARAAAIAAGATIAPISVDSQGLDVTALDGLAIAARAVFVTPTHQFPLGVTMSLQRRLALKNWAARNGGWILEDDYDSEYRYEGRPFDPLAVLDKAGQVIYIGTFSKVMFPALRLGYLVVPPRLVDVFEAAHLSSDIHRPVLEQAALVRFMEDGHFGRHLRKTREAHAERRDTLLRASALSLSGLLEVHPASAGLHLFGQLPAGTDDTAIARAAATRGIDVWPLSLHALDDERRGILLGYGGVPPHLIESGVTQLAAALQGA